MGTKGFLMHDRSSFMLVPFYLVSATTMGYSQPSSVSSRPGKIIIGCPLQIQRCSKIRLARPVIVSMIGNLSLRADVASHRSMRHRSILRCTIENLTMRYL